MQQQTWTRKRARTTSESKLLGRAKGDRPILVPFRLKHASFSLAVTAVASSLRLRSENSGTGRRERENRIPSPEIPYLSLSPLRIPLDCDVDSVDILAMHCLTLE